MGRFRGLVVLIALAASLLPVPAGATPVCTDGYEGGPPLDLCGGRIFPEANNSTDYVQYLPDPVTGFAEYQHGIEYLAQKYPRWVSTFTLSGRYNDRDAVSAGPDGNRSYESDDEGDGHEIFVIKLTDHQVDDVGKETLLYSLSIHGDEKGGIEGGVRAAEDLAIAAEEGGTIADGVAGYESDTGRVPEIHTYEVKDVLAKEIVYLVDFNMDGWRRGDHFADTPGLYTRTNQMGTDLNRQMPTVGYIDPRRNPLQESEMLYGHRFMHEVSAAGVGGQMAYGADVHGEGQSRAWADIMYPAGQFDSIKHRRLMSIAERTKSVIDATLFMGIPDLIEAQTGGDSGEGIEDLGGPVNTVPSKPARWGTVWDTLGYTDTGFLGDYMATELGVTGMDYEIAMNHADNTRPYGRPWGVIFQENYINATRAIIKTAMAYAMSERTDFADFQLDPGGRVGYVYNPDTITDTDQDGPGRLPGPQANPTPPPAGPVYTGIGADGKPVEQRPYDATNMQFFEDANAYVKGGVNKALPADIASSSSYLDQFDTLMIADVALPEDLIKRTVDPAAYYANLKSWVERGGNLVLTDRALHALGEMGIVPKESVKNVTVYQPYANISDFEHSMVQGLRGNARQLSEATLIGYGIGNNASPMTVVTTEAWDEAGGQIVATTGNNAGTSDDGTQTSVGELKLGKGIIRIMGGGLHMPTEQNDHRYGLKDYSLTYTGLYILENSMKYDVPELGKVVEAVATNLELSNTRSGQYTDKAPLGAVLTDASGAPVPDAVVTFELSSEGIRQSWTGVTGSDGSVTVPARLLLHPGNYVLKAIFNGKVGAYNADTSDLATFVVEKEDTRLKLRKKGKRTKKGKRVKTRLVAVLTDADDRSRGVAAVPVIFRGRKAGVLGSSITNGKGRAVFKVKRRFWRKRSFRAVFNGTSDIYWHSSTIKVRGWRRRP